MKNYFATHEVKPVRILTAIMRMEFPNGKKHAIAISQVHGPRRLWSRVARMCFYYGAPDSLGLAYFRNVQNISGEPFM